MSMELEIISPKYGKYIVYYDDKDHEIISKHNWRIHRKRTKVYAVTGIYDNKTQKSKGLLMHVLIFGKKGIDHIDHNGLNNYRSNLRQATQSQNAKNQSLSVLNKFGVKGVSYSKAKKRYSVHITNDYKHIFLGYFSSLVDAAKKYNEAAKKYHGEFASLNTLTEEIELELRKFDLPAREWKVKSTNTSGFRGVGLYPPSSSSLKPYFSHIKVNGKNIHLGSFENKIDAAKAYNDAALKYLKSDALLNTIPE